MALIKQAFKEKHWKFVTIPVWGISEKCWSNDGNKIPIKFPHGPRTSSARLFEPLASPSCRHQQYSVCLLCLSQLYRPPVDVVERKFIIWISSALKLAIKRRVETKISSINNIMNAHCFPLLCVTWTQQAIGKCQSRHSPAVKYNPVHPNVPPTVLPSPIDSQVMNIWWKMTKHDIAFIMPNQSQTVYWELMARKAWTEFEIRNLPR